MKTAAIVCEYNPLHKGHVYHLERTRAVTGCDRVLCLMSGNFVQRGEPAILGKRVRAEHAVRAGADLVLELPTAFACSFAEQFAYGAVATLNRIPSVEFLSFGIEEGSLEELQTLADLLTDEPPELSTAIRSLLKQGLGYPRAQAEAVKLVAGSVGTLLDRANNILAIEYLKALKRTRSRIRPIAIPRVGDPYRAERPDSAITSATAVRTLLREGSDVSAYVPSFCLDALARPVSDAANERFYTLVRNALLAAAPAEVAALAEVKEGFEHKLIDAAKTCGTYETFFGAVKSKRFTAAAVRRICLNLLLGFTKSFRESVQKTPIYNVLAYGDETLLKEIPDPILDYAQAADYRIRAMIDYQLRADRLYALLLGQPFSAGKSFYTAKIDR